MLRWEWIGEPTGVEDGATYYKAARGYPQDLKQEPVVIRPGSPFVIDTQEDEPLWGAICTELCEFSKERLLKVMRDEDSDPDELKRVMEAEESELHGERMRIGVRWLYRPCDFASDLEASKAALEDENENDANDSGMCAVPVPDSVILQQNEMLMTDYYSAPNTNTLGVVHDTALLVSSQREFAKFVEKRNKGGKAPEARNVFVCELFYWAVEVDSEVDRDILEKYWYVRGRLRPLPAAELKQLTKDAGDQSGPLHDRHRFWTGATYKRPAKRRCTAKKAVLKTRDSGALAEASGPSVPPIRRPETSDPATVAAFHAKLKQKLTSLTLENVLPAGQLEVVRNKIQELTPEQADALLEHLPTLTKELTRQYLERRTSRNLFESYPSVRHGAVESVCKKYWELATKSGEQG